MGDATPLRAAGAPVRRALVIGLGRSGSAAVRALLAHDVEVVATDRSEDVAAPDGVDLHAGLDEDGQARLVDDVDLVVPSPGVRADAPALRAAEGRSIPIWSEPELGWRLYVERAGAGAHEVVAVTGTNGKTTVTELTTAMLRAGGRDAVDCGNIGHPFTDAAAKAGTERVLVAELSSFQLEFVERLRPSVGVLLNVSPDHLDWHGSTAAYERAKARLWTAQTSADWAVGNAEDPTTGRLVRRHAPGNRAWFSTSSVPSPGVGVRDGSLVADLPASSGTILPLERLALRAPHHVANVAAAACAALLVGADPAAVAAAATGFKPGAHRHALVAAGGGIDWIDDSKATNTHATTAALRAVRASERPIVWIGGGLAKGVDLSVLENELADVRHAVLIGEAADELAAIARDAGVATSIAASIEAAVREAAAIARPGDTVLLSPACASFDQFRDYAERGDRFTTAARAAAAEVAGESGGRDGTVYPEKPDARVPDAEVEG